MEHPAQSPDWNPIEYVRNEHDRKLRKWRPKNHQDLWIGAQNVWETMSKEYLQGLSDRMPRICVAIIKARREYFDETLRCKDILFLFNWN